VVAGAVSLREDAMARAWTLVTMVVLLLIQATPARAQAPAPRAPAETRPFQLALFNPVQIFPARYGIKGLRIDLLYGKNASLTGVDLGLVNHVTGSETGFTYGLVSVVEGNFTGWQDNVVNVTQQHFEGFQSGFVNVSEDASGFMLGIVNYAGTLNGLQIGLVNVISKGGAFPVFPIVNWSFR
jgi:hypothetical protein